MNWINGINWANGLNWVNEFGNEMIGMNLMHGVN